MAMKKYIKNFLPAAILCLLIPLVSSCFKKQDPVTFDVGIFPDTVVNLAGLNTAYDDYNVDINSIYNYIPMVFSSNRGSSGGQFDIVQAAFEYSFNQITGEFTLFFNITDDPFLRQLLAKVNTTGNDFGPNRFYSPVDGYEYMVLSSEDTEGNLDLKFTKNLPYFGSGIPEVTGPFDVVKINSASDEAYFCLDVEEDSVYFTSDSGGDFDIFMLGRDATATMDTWLGSTFEAPVNVEILNSTGNDKCPYIYRKVMVFTSDRPGGFGGYDLYYSVFKNGNWGDPVNMGPAINTASDEYRPVLSGDEDFSNMYLIFSSDRPGGLGGFDLYYSGIGLK